MSWNLKKRITPGLLVIGIATLAGCASPMAAGPTAVAPAIVEPIPGTDTNRITLTARAAERLGIQTAPVRATTGAGAATRSTVIPYSAVLYEADGTTFSYISPAPLQFVRHDITVTGIQGEDALLSAGPAAGVQVVTVGAAELLGAESEIGH